MNINLNKRKQSARWGAIERFSGDRIGERTGGRPSVLANQKVGRRLRHKNPEERVETPSRPLVERPVSAREIMRRRVGASAHPLRERLLEGSVVLAAGLSLIVKNGISHIAGWIRDGRERVTGSESNTQYQWEGGESEEYEEGIWDGDDGEETGDGSGQPVWKQARRSDAVDEIPLPPESPLREEKELNKVNRLDAEEDGLPDEELDDQAGALRARLSEASRHS